MDDTPAEILEANVLFRAVPVPPGRHIVRFEFEPIAGAIAEISQPQRRRGRKGRGPCAGA